MTATLCGLWRYPIKGIGREPLDQIALTEGAPIPGDRAWALLHAGAPDVDDWQPRRNFLVVANGPRLAQITARTAKTDEITLDHPDGPTLRINPATDGSALIDWVTPYWPERLRPPHRLVRAPAQGMPDNGLPQVSVLNLASLRALSDKLGQRLEIERFRGNLILDRLEPWEEFEWVGRTLQIGNVRLDVTGRIRRCRATQANTVTGRQDAETLQALQNGWGHLHFGVYATVRSNGSIAVGDSAAVM